MAEQQLNPRSAGVGSVGCRTCSKGAASQLDQSRYLSGVTGSGLGASHGEKVAFLERAERVLDSLYAKAKEIGAPSTIGWWGQSAYEQQWDPVLDSLISIQTEAGQVLEPGTDEMAQFLDGSRAVNLAITRLRHSMDDASWSDVLEVLTTNPIRALKFVLKDTAASAGNVASEAGGAIMAGGQKVIDAVASAGKWGVVGLLALAFIAWRATK